MTIVITLPSFIPQEAERICNMLADGTADIVHIRKPEASLEEVEALVREILAIRDVSGQLVLHDHHSLAAKYHLRGIHLNSRNPLPPNGYEGSISRSCHTLYEVAEWKPLCDYVSLSPIFDSISKQGYNSAFTADDIAHARSKGIIDNKVLALGGVTFDRLPQIRQMGFGGGMILGDAWRTSYDNDNDNFRFLSLSHLGESEGG